MTRYLLRRILQAIPTLLGVTLLTFALVRLAPGDPCAAEEESRNGANRNGICSSQLNEPLPVQYVGWLGRVVQLDLGTSIQRREPVAAMIGQRLSATLELTGTGLAIGILVGLPLGALAALRRGNWIDGLVRVIAVAGDAVPHYWLGLLAMSLFAFGLHLLPSSGRCSLNTGCNDVGDRIAHLIMPGMVLATGWIAVSARYLRSELIDVLWQDFIRTARSKGIPEKTVVLRHAMRNALIPTATILGGSLPVLFSGAALTENVFGWPGLGRLAVESVAARDFPVTMGLVLVSATLVISGSLLTDVLYSIVDPRIRFE